MVKHARKYYPVTNTKKKPFVCNEKRCGKSFDTEFRLNAHKVSHGKKSDKTIFSIFVTNGLLEKINKDVEKINENSKHVISRSKFIVECIMKALEVNENGQKIENNGTSDYQVNGEDRNKAGRISIRDNESRIQAA